MTLTPMPKMLKQALEGGYALGYFEAWDAYSLEAVLEASEEERSPAILGFGGMMVDRAWLDNGGVTLLGAVGRSLAERARVPVCLLLNEVPAYGHALQGMDVGFNAIMLDTEDLPTQEASEQVKRLVKEAHSRGAAVEAEIGTLATATLDGVDRSRSKLTNPDEAADFVAATGVDCLGVSIGNIHMLTGEVAPVDMERLAAIRRRVNVPLVIHGGTSFPPEAVPQAIAHGVAKFNVGTVLKQVFLAGVQETIGGWSDTVNVQVVLGSHKQADLMAAGKAQMKAKVKELIRLYRSAGKAS